MKQKNKTDNKKEYSDLILVDLLHLDWKNLFSRYKVDLIGFIIFVLLMALIIVGTYFLIKIGK